MRRLLPAALSAVAIVVASGSCVVAVAAPASAHTSTIGPLTTTVGHVAGQVSTDAPYVELTLLTSGRRTVVGPTVQAVPAGRTVDFDLATWGMESGYVSLRACNDDTATSCDSAVSSEQFTALDVAPTITWPDDTKIGPDDSYDVTVDDDPSAGGELRALWVYSGYETPLPHDGTATIKVSDATGGVRVRRCSSAHTDLCRTVVTGPVITVNRTVHGTVTLPDDGRVISPTAGTNLEPEIHISSGPEQAGPITLDWRITRNGFGPPIISGTEADVALSNASFSFSIDLTGLADGRYYLDGALSWTGADYGTVSGQLGLALFKIDVTPPVIESVVSSRPAVYPYQDRYHDFTEIALRPTTFDSQDKATIEIVDAAGTVVRSLFPPLRGTGRYAGSYLATWDGRDADDAMVPAGTYRIVGRLTDHVGNVSTTAGPSIVVVRKRLSTSARTFRRTVTPYRSFAADWIGACSSVRRPSARGWRGSFGLYSNTKCHRGRRASIAETQHAIRVPSAPAYDTATISVYGGAARVKPWSLGGLTYLKRNNRWGYTTRLGASLGSHRGVTQRADLLLHDGRWLYWAVTTAYGQRYDVKSFTVKVRYYVLVAE